jgi:hypothetical protein
MNWKICRRVRAWVRHYSGLKRLRKPQNVSHDSQLFAWIRTGHYTNKTQSLRLCTKPLHSFSFMWPYIVTNFFVIKPTRRTDFSNLFWNETLHVSDSSSVHHQELFTVHTAMVYVYKPVWHIVYTIAEFTVNNSWWWTEELSETCRVSFQNKFQKLVRLVGFITKRETLHDIFCIVNRSAQSNLELIQWRPISYTLKT